MPSCIHTNVHTHLQRTQTRTCIPIQCTFVCLYVRMHAYTWCNLCRFQNSTNCIQNADDIQCTLKILSKTWENTRTSTPYYGTAVRSIKNSERVRVLSLLSVPFSLPFTLPLDLPLTPHPRSHSYTHMCARREFLSFSKTTQMSGARDHVQAEAWTW